MIPRCPLPEYCLSNIVCCRPLPRLAVSISAIIASFFLPSYQDMKCPAFHDALHQCGIGISPWRCDATSSFSASHSSRSPLLEHAAMIGANLSSCVVESFQSADDICLPEMHCATVPDLQVNFQLVVI